MAILHPHVYQRPVICSIHCFFKTPKRWNFPRSSRIQAVDHCATCNPGYYISGTGCKAAGPLAMEV